MTFLNDFARLKEHHVWMTEEVATQLLAAGNFLSQQGVMTNDEYLTYLCELNTDELKLSADKVNGRD